MNTEQIFGQLRIILAAFIGYAAGRHWIGDDTASLIMTVVPVAGPMLWSFLAHTHFAQISAVAKIEAVKGIVVDKSVASDGVMAAVKDKELPTVVAAGTVDAEAVAAVATGKS